MIEASSQLQTNHEMSAVKSVHQAARQVSRWNVSSSRPVPADGFHGPGKTINASNRNRLASKIEADRCNQRTNINASDTGVRRSADFGNYTLRAGATQSSANVTQYPPEICSRGRTQNKMPKPDRICSRSGTLTDLKPNGNA